MIAVLRMVVFVLVAATVVFLWARPDPLPELPTYAAASELLAAPQAQAQPPLEPFPELTVQALAADCLPALSARYPRGRLLKVQINQQMEICNALLETDVGSNRFIGVQRAYRRLDFQLLGEVRLPASYLQPGPLPEHTLDWNALLQRDLAALPGELIDQQKYPQAKVWAMQVVWMPAPYARAVWMVGFNDEADEFQWMLDVDTEAQASEVVRDMPGLAADLADPAATPDTVAEREADKLALFALEGGPALPGTVYEAATWCVDALNEYNNGARVLRVVLQPGACMLVVEPVDGSRHWLVWYYRGYRDYSEVSAVVLPDAYADLPNFTIDPAWLNAQSLQERLQRAGIAAPPDFIGIAWDPLSRDGFWIVEPASQDSTQTTALRFDRSGATSAARFPRATGDVRGDPDAPLFSPGLEALP